MITTTLKRVTGFTLVETIATISIGLIILTIVLIVYVAYNRLYATESNLADAERNNSFILNGITAEIRAAKNVLTGRMISGVTYTTGTSTVVLEYPVFDTGNNLVSGVSDYGALFLDPGNTGNTILSFEAHPSSKRSTGTKILGNYVDTLLLRYNKENPAAATNVTVFLTTRSVDMPRGKGVVTKMNSISLRND